MNNPRFSFLTFTVFFLRNDCTWECPPGNGWVGICPEMGMTAVENFLIIFFYIKSIATLDVKNFLPATKPPKVTL